MRVLVTRAAPDAARTARRLAARGHAPIICPLLTIVPTGEAPPAGPFDALVLTSRNAVAPAALAGLARRPVFAVGSRTAEAARASGFAPVTACGGDAGAMVRHILRDRPPPARLLLAAGRDRKAEPERALRAAGYGITFWVAYEAQAAEALPETARAAIERAELDAVLHYSARSAALVRRLAEEAGLAEAFGRARHLCLSVDVAGALDGLAHVEAAARPDEDALLRLLDQ